MPDDRGTGSGGRRAYELLVDALTELAAAGRIAGPVAAAALTAWSALHGLAALLGVAVDARRPDGHP